MRVDSSRGSGRVSVGVGIVARKEFLMSTDAAEQTVTFADLGLRDELLSALNALGYEEPTPIQAE